MPRIGLVLGAGGVTGGAFHAGVLSALATSTGWDPRNAELIVGTSAGSVTAAGLRAGVSAGDMAARALGEPLSPEGAALFRSARLPTGPPLVPTGARIRFGRPAAPEVLVAAFRRPWAVRPTALMAGLLPAGSVSTAGISESFDALHPNGWPGGPSGPLSGNTREMWACAVRLRDGALVVFGRSGSPAASVGHAVAASCAIPGFFEPVEIDGDRYVDGGAHSLTNVGEVASRALDLVIVSAPMARSGIGRYTPGNAMREMGRAQLAREAQRLRRRGIAVVAFRPTPGDERAMGLNAMDPGRRADVVRRVRESARRRIEEVGDRLAALTG